MVLCTKTAWVAASVAVTRSVQRSLQCLASVDRDRNQRSRQRHRCPRCDDVSSDFTGPGLRVLWDWSINPILEPPMQRDFSSFVEINRLTKNLVVLVDSIQNLAFRKNITGTVKQRENNWNDKEMGFAGVCGYLLAFAGYLRAFCG